MSNQNPVSPLTAMIRRSVGIVDGAPSPAQPQQAMTQRGPGGTMPAPGTLPGGQLRGQSVATAVRNSNLGIYGRIPQQQAQQQQAQVQRAGGGVTADEIGAAIGEAVGRLLTPVLQQLERTLDQTNAQQQQQAMVQQATFAPTPQRLPIPQTGPGTTGQTVVIQHGATTAGGYANAMLNELRHGSMPAAPSPMVQRSYADSNPPISPNTGRPSQITAVVRRSMGLGW